MLASINILILILCYSYIRYDHCRKLGETYMRSLCSTFAMSYKST